jgi:hypothetical protein
MNRRRFSSWFAALLPAGFLKADVQSAGATNRPACPICRAASSPEAELGWLVTSEKPDPITLVGWKAVKVVLCVKCGALFAAAGGQ